jgi:hypothetical protein
VNDHRRVVRIVTRPDGLPRPEHPKLQGADPKRATCAGGDDGDMSAACGREGRLFVGARRWNPRIEHRVDAQAAQDPRGAADVVALRVGEDDRGEAANAETAQLTCHVRLRRALVDQDVPFRDLQEDRVALPDIQRSDP